MADFKPGDRVAILDGSDFHGRIAYVSDDSVKALKPSKGIVYVKLGRFHVPFADHDLRPAWQTCKDCDGSGRVMERGLYTTWDDCPTCDGDGRINRTGPYRLKMTPGKPWSDGVDRSKRIDTRKVSARFEVTIGKYSSHVWHEAHQTKEFDKWAEAIAYADRMARTNQGGVS